MKKIKKGVLILIASILLLGGGGFVGWKYVFADKGEPEKEEVKEELSSEELKELKVDIETIQTHLAGETSSYGAVAFSVQVEHLEAKEEFEVRLAEMKSLIISSLNASTPSDLKQVGGKEELEKRILKEMNNAMKHGKVEHLYITDYRIVG